PHLPGAAHRRCRPPRPPQGMTPVAMTDPGIFAAIALLLPATSFLILDLRYPLRRSGRPAGLVSILCAAGALAAALRAWSLETPEGMTRITYEGIPQEAGALAPPGARDRES